jgi:hypothetical protein
VDGMMGKKYRLVDEREDASSDNELVAAKHVTSLAQKG